MDNDEKMTSSPLWSSTPASPRKCQPSAVPAILSSSPAGGPSPHSTPTPPLPPGSPAHPHRLRAPVPPSGLSPAPRLLPSPHLGGSRPLSLALRRTGSLGDLRPPLASGARRGAGREGEGDTGSRLRGRGDAMSAGRSKIERSARAARAAPASLAELHLELQTTT